MIVIVDYGMGNAAGLQWVDAETRKFDFTSVIQKENIYGTQFHPEKSQRGRSSEGSG
jgi:hypothetical protein